MDDIVKRLRDPNRKGQEYLRGDAADEIERLRTALRRIISLEEKNVPKYAQQIAREAVEQ